MSIDAATIAALTSAQPRVSQPVQVTVISTPDNQVPARIQGEVTQVKPNGEAVISTKSGEVTVKTEPLLVRGQRVDIKLPTQSLPNLPQNTLPQLPLNGQLTVVAQGKASLPIELPLTPPVLVTASSDQGNPQTTTNVALYNVPKIGASVQNVLQLLGLDLPASLQKASVLPPSLTQQSGQASQRTRRYKLCKMCK